jgi:hypothetical protein
MSFTDTRVFKPKLSLDLHLRAVKPEVRAVRRCRAGSEQNDEHEIRLDSAMSAK